MVDFLKLYSEFRKMMSFFQTLGVSVSVQGVDEFADEKIKIMNHDCFQLSNYQDFFLDVG